MGSDIGIKKDRPTLTSKPPEVKRTPPSGGGSSNPTGSQKPAAPGDSYEAAKKPVVNLTGEGPVSFKDGTTTPSGGGTTTSSVSTGNGNVTVSQTNKGEDGSQTSGSVAVTQDSVTVAGSASQDGVGVNGSVNVTGDGITVSGGADVSPVKGLKIKFGTQVSATSNVKSEDGVTTLTAEGSMSVSLGGEVSLGKVGFGADHTEGVRTRYQLRMSDADYAQVQSGQAPMPDPYNPDTMPTGSSVLMNSTDFESTGFKASYDFLKGECKVGQEQGLSVMVEKTGTNTVRVTAGPTEAVENSFKLGIGVGPVSASVGNKTRLDEFTAKTAEFDLSTDEGQAAYNNFLATGELPQDNGTGIANVATIEKIKYDSTSSAGINLGPLSGSVDFANSNMNIVRTTYPDGSTDQVSDFKLHGGTPVHLEQHFNADGTEDLSKQQASVFFEGMKGAQEELFAAAYGVDQHDFDGQMDVNLSFNPQQSQELAARAQAYIDNFEATTGQQWDPMLPNERLIDSLAKAENATDVAKALADVFGEPGWIGQAFMDLAIDPTTGQISPPPGTIEARHR